MGSHPLRAFEDAVTVTGRVGEVARKTYVRCEKFPVDYGPRMVERLPAEGWVVQRWDAVHDVMVTEPERVRDLVTS